MDDHTDGMFVRGLTAEENEILAGLIVKFLRNRSEHHLSFRGTPWSTDTDCVVYVDKHGCDTAYGDGADTVLAKHLTESEIDNMNHDGFVIKKDKIFAFSTFLMESFVKASVIMKVQERNNAEIRQFLSQLANGEYDGETINGEYDDPLLEVDKE